ncbi:hypothetical protein CK203_107429 [Vitis vinifera]|uniref:Uncharacterized protein n=1 Tax=Vitis vinifera TaxID=29760 RepID=A0A438FHX7_VITVI|nr:hypothetical protein CK203_107429 [Vitis vinifera]
MAHPIIVRIKKVKVMIQKIKVRVQKFGILMCRRYEGAFFPTLWISLSGKIDAGIDFKQVVEDMLGQALNWHDKDYNIQFGRDQKRNGNAVIITTRLEEVAKGMVGDKYCIAWKALNDKLKKMQNEIVEQCDGFPLGVKTLAEIIPAHWLRIIPVSMQNQRGDTLTQIITVPHRT